MEKVFGVTDQMNNVLDFGLESLIKSSFKLKNTIEAEDVRKFSVDPFENFGLKNPRITRRSTCAGSGVGNLGFNSFNFLTFMVLTFNAIANTNNNINNNNNNDNNINLNSISQDSSSATSNSDNTNNVMVTILPPPVGKREVKEFEENCQNGNQTLKLGDFVADGKEKVWIIKLISFTV